MIEFICCLLGVRGHYLVIMIGGPGRCVKCGRMPGRWESWLSKWHWTDPKEERADRKRFKNIDRALRNL